MTYVEPKLTKDEIIKLTTTDGKPLLLQSASILMAEGKVTAAQAVADAQELMVETWRAWGQLEESVTESPVQPSEPVAGVITEMWQHISGKLALGIKDQEGTTHYTIVDEYPAPHVGDEGSWAITGIPVS